MEFPTIYVSLTEKGHPDDCDCGNHYSAIVMDWDNKSEQWHNTGLVCWGKSPTAAFNEALDWYNRVKESEE